MGRKEAVAIHEVLVDNQQAAESYLQSKEKQRLFIAMSYAAGIWDRERRVIVKAEYSRRGNNPRYVVTSLSGSEQNLYDKLYCVRGDMGNCIKEQQLCLFADRTSATIGGPINSACCYPVSLMCCWKPFGVSVL
ncbi:MAG: hypothetical protein CSA34_06125 [Desulfobulbus propionicus]|nr:MAG: hypothetical protein CSA34_06125 [Desulfobulbus propionicus]